MPKLTPTTAAALREDADRICSAPLPRSVRLPSTVRLAGPPVPKTVKASFPSPPFTY